MPAPHSGKSEQQGSDTEEPLRSREHAGRLRDCESATQAIAVSLLRHYGIAQLAVRRATQENSSSAVETCIREPSHPLGAVAALFQTLNSRERR